MAKYLKGSDSDEWVEGMQTKVQRGVAFLSWSHTKQISHTETQN
jgi:hypothetical protein